MSSDNHNDDTTSLGYILVAMGLVTPGQLAAVLEEQEKVSLELLIGKLMVANHMISTDQLDKALKIQEKLRSKNKSVRAKTQANIAQTGSANVIQLASRLRETVFELKKATTQNNPVITQEMLSKSKIES